MRSTRRFGIVAFTVAGLAGGIASPQAFIDAASADGSGRSKFGTFYSKGITLPASDPPGVYSYSSWVTASNKSSCKPDLAKARTNANVKMNGDHIYVADTCRDSKSSYAEVGWRYSGGVYPIVYRCYNKLGAGTVAKCNFDWDEKPYKSLVSYAADPDGGGLITGHPKHFSG